jgi:hypothetical protein
MSSLQETKTIPLYVDSSYRDDADSTNSNDYTLSLRKTIRRVRRATVASVEIPKTFDNIHNNNNIFLIVIEKSNDRRIHIIKLPIECNILLESVAFALKNELQLIQEDITWDVIYVSQTCKMIITAKRNNEDVTDIFLIPGPANTAIGYSVKTNGVVTIESGKTVHKFTSSVINLIPTHLIVTSTILSNFINTSYINSTSKTVKIDSSNNELKIKEWGTNPITDRTIVIPSGFYMLRDIGNIIEEYLSGVNNKYTVLFNGTHMEVYLENIGSITFSIDPESSICKVLGWEDFPLPDDMKGVVEHTGNIIEMSVFNNMLYKIPLNSNISTIHSYTPNGVLISSNNIVDNIVYSQNMLRNENDYASGFSLDVIDLQLRYPNEMLVDLNNAEWSATLLIDTNQ